MSRYPSRGGELSQPNAPVRPFVICFPPTPPPLDRAFVHLALSMPPRLTPPPELAACVNEPFYAPLSTWLLEKALTENMRQRIDTLRAAEAGALADLRATLDETRDADSATRRLALEVLARQQTPQLVTLERDAEQIRADLAIGRYDWRALREWALGDKNTRGDSPAEIAATMRAYAYYQSGLVPAQRRLLREISLELTMAAGDTAAAEAAQPFLFFPPEPARVLLPDDLPADLAAQVAAYQTEKSALKKELYDTIYNEDSAALAFMRNSALKALAGKQAPRLAELEPLAEDIRRGLAELPSTTPRDTERSALPPVLTEQLNATFQAAFALQRETIKRIDAVRVELGDAPIQVSYSFETDGLKFVVTPRPARASSTTADPNGRLEKLRPPLTAAQNAMAEIADDFGRRYAELLKESDAIRRDAAAALGNPPARVVEAALASARWVAMLKDSEDGYRDYRTAVFEPGLSPEQRRLLFGSALEKLDLPLPRGEFQPVRRAASW
jgi:hypothetical protein